MSLKDLKKKSKELRKIFQTELWYYNILNYFHRLCAVSFSNEYRLLGLCLRVLLLSFVFYSNLFSQATTTTTATTKKSTNDITKKSWKSCDFILIFIYLFIYFVFICYLFFWSFRVYLIFESSNLQSLWYTTEYCMRTMVIVCMKLLSIWSFPLQWSYYEIICWWFN